jgi:hypothetical protein
MQAGFSPTRRIILSVCPHYRVTLCESAASSAGTFLTAVPLHCQRQGSVLPFGLSTS